MRLLKSFVLLTLIFVYCQCNEKLEIETNDEEEERKGKQLIDKVELGGWRTLNPQEWRNSDDWVPREEYFDNPPRRRRIRKRKRRPSIENENPEPQLAAHTLEDVDETWMEMDDESVKMPHNRRRVVPAYLANLDENEGRTPLYEKVRDPFTALEEAEAKSRMKKKPEAIEATTKSNLKAILKQSGGSLNLSELLQRKNLSLTDLLNGKQQAISALTEKPDGTITESIKKVTKLPNYAAQSTSRNFEATNHSENMSLEPEVLNDSQGTRLFEVTSESTTEKKVFIPTYPKIIPFHYKHSTVKVTSTSGPITITTTKDGTRAKVNDYRTKYAALRPKLHNSLPVTSAKLNKAGSSAVNKTVHTVTTPIPLQAFTINLQDLFGFSQITQSSSKSTEDEPLRMKILIETSTENKPKFTTAYFEKLKPSNAREEIMEVLKDQKGRQNLSRILLVRNMTLEELVEQRERGSSQVHLADIFHNQTREPEPPSEPYVGVITEHVGRKPKTLHNQMSVSSPPTDLNLENNKRPTYSVTSFPTYKIAMDRLLQKNQSVPLHRSVLKTLYPNLYVDNNSKELEEKKETMSESRANVDEILQDGVRMIEDVENSISEAVNHKFNVEVVENHNYDDSTFNRLPNGVKSAIIASTAVVAVSILVFLTILIICKWSNKKKKPLCYSDVYSGSRIKSPILNTRPKRTIRTIMHETLGRNKNYSNVYPQNISDYFWESDKKPFQ